MPLLAITQAAKELGCSAEHIRRQVRAGRWPAYQLGTKAMRIDTEEIKNLGRLVHEGKVESRAAEGR